MATFKALLLTLLVGFFFLFGYGIMKFIKKKQTFTLFATGLSFIVMISMVLFDIIPEIAYNLVDISLGRKWFIVIFFSLLGMLFLKILDIIVPHHHHEHHEHEKNKKEHNHHMFHIGFVTSISLILHNLIEGLSIYMTSLADFKMGLLMTLAVSLHNIPLGMYITNMEQVKSKKKVKFITLFLLTISSFIGAFLLFLLHLDINEIILTYFLCITFGMLLYISLFELLREIWNYRKSKPIYVGILVGIVLNVLMVIL